MESYFHLKQTIIKTLDFFEKKYTNDIITAIKRTYSESISGYDILEYRIRLILLNYAVILKKVSFPKELLDESLENLIICKSKISLLNLNIEEENDLLNIIENVTNYLSETAYN